MCVLSTKVAVTAAQALVALRRFVELSAEVEVALLV